jgi:hypothetical protein
MTQHSESVLIGNRHAPESWSQHVRDAVMFREQLVDERVVGGQQLDNVRFRSKLG